MRPLKSFPPMNAVALKLKAQHCRNLAAAHADAKVGIRLIHMAEDYDERAEALAEVVEQLPTIIVEQRLTSRPVLMAELA